MTDEVAGLLFIGGFVLAMAAVVLWVWYEERQSPRAWAEYLAVPPGHIHRVGRSCERCIEALERECGITHNQAGNGSA